MDLALRTRADRALGLVSLAAVAALSCECGAASERSQNVDAGTDASSATGGCVLREPVPPPGHFYTPGALPSGACTAPASCKLLVQEPCPCGSGPIDEYECICGDESWTCAVSSQGGIACTCPVPDSGRGPDADSLDAGIE